jgi:hypothetical protein
MEVRPLGQSRQFGFAANLSSIDKIHKTADSLPIKSRPVVVSSLPPRCPVRRSGLRWAKALDGEDDDSSSTESDADDDDEDDGASCGSYWSHDDSSKLELVEDESDMEEDDDDVETMDYILTPHDWTFAPNTILPSIQMLFREAAARAALGDENLDINQRILQSIAASS